MAAAVIGGPRTWSFGMDAEGYRTYLIKYLIKHDAADGPATIFNATGLPAFGSTLAVAGFTGTDAYAWRRLDTKFELHQHREGDPHRYHTAEIMFSSKPTTRCQDTAITDPLLEPQKVSGSFVDGVEEATKDRFGNPIVNSAWEQLRGKKVEFDKGTDTVHIEQNVAVLNLPLVTSMRNTLNDATLWGMATRCVKLSKFTWEKKFYGLCYTYYTRTFDFDINAGTFDRDIMDEGEKALNGVMKSGEWVVKPIKVTKSSPREISDATNATPIEINSSAHGLTVGQQITITGATGNTAANGTWKVKAVVDANKFTIKTLAGADSVGNGLYIVGGTWTKPVTVMPNRLNPNHFVRAKDVNNEVIHVILDGYGLPVDITPGSGSGIGGSTPGNIHVEKYTTSNLLLLGIPATL